MRKRQHKQRQVHRAANAANSLVHDHIGRHDLVLDKARHWLITSVQINHLKHYIFQHVKNPADVDGRVQDTLLAVLETYPDFRGDSSVQTWLIGIAKHQIAHYYRLTDNATNCSTYDGDIAPNNGTEEEAAYHAAMLEEPFERLSSVSKECQQILYWHAVEGLHYAEIGKKLGVSEDAVKHRIFRAKQVLRKAREKKQE